MTDMYWRSQNDPTEGELLEVSKIATLTKLERELIALIGGGFKDRQIADRLLISEEEMAEELTSIFDKLGVSNRLELVIYAYHYDIASLQQ